MISELIEKIFGWNNRENSRDQAKRRLKLVIAHDRAGLSSETIDLMRQEIMEVVARYVDVDSDASEFTLESDDRMTALIASLPIKRVRELELAVSQIPVVVEEVEETAVETEIETETEAEISTNTPSTPTEEKQEPEQSESIE